LKSASTEQIVLTSNIGAILLKRCSESLSNLLSSQKNQLLCCGAKTWHEVLNDAVVKGEEQANDSEEFMSKVTDSIKQKIQDITTTAGYQKRLRRWGRYQK